MTAYTNIVLIITVAVFISYLNYRFVKMQPTIAIMTTSLFLSVILVVLDQFGLRVVHDNVTLFVHQLHFRQILMNSMLGLLLFAGALTIDIVHLRKQKLEILILSTMSVIASTLFIGFGTFYLLNFFNLYLPFSNCLLFGALISPTDPIAVLATFKESGAPKKLSMLVAGESLFNDGVGVVLFVSLYHLVFAGKAVSFSSAVLLFAQQAFGGIGFGLLLGLLAYFLMAPIDDPKIEILVTIALVTGGYTLAQSIGVSGPLAMVAAGIFIAANKDRIFHAEKTQENLESFWELIDELLNAILFLLMGAEILLIHFSAWLVGALVAAIPLTLFARLMTVAVPMYFFKSSKTYPTYTIRILTWGGLRGGLAVALALALPNDGPTQAILLPMTYTVVLFSILVQGTTVQMLVKRSQPRWLAF